MAEAEGSNSGANFQLWIRRRAEPAGPYSIRFEVTEGKGILRVIRPGVLVDPPARPSGFEERLTAAQVGTTRFLHVWDGGRFRQPHSFARLHPATLDTIPVDRWIALVTVAEGVASLFYLPADLDAEPSRVDDEPTWPRRQILADLQRELRQMDAPAAPQKPSRAERVEIAPRLASALVEPDPPSLPLAGLDALLNAPRVTQSRVAQRPLPPEEQQTVLMAGSALAIDRMDDIGPPVRSVLARLDSQPARPSSVIAVSMQPEDHPAIEAIDDADDLYDAQVYDEGVYDEGAHEPDELIEATGETAFEMLEAGGDDDDAFGLGDDDAAPVVLEAHHRHEILHRGQITEPVTIIPLDAHEIATVAAGIAVELVRGGGADVAHGTSIEADGLDEFDEVEVIEGARPVDAAHPFDASPVPTLHERNTTLVRFLRRRIASDRTRIAALEHRIAELEAMLAQGPRR